MKTSPERFVVTTNDKKLLWNPTKPLRLPLPHQSELVSQMGTCIVRDLQTKKVISEFEISNIRSLEDFVVPGTDIKIFQAKGASSAADDVTRMKAPIQMTAETDIFVYEGSGKQLHLFEKVNKSWNCQAFKVQTKNGQLSIHPHDKLTLKVQNTMDVELHRDQPYFLDLKDLPKVEIHDGQRWWKFAAFSAPILLDESEFDLIDAQEMKQDRVFQTVFVMGIAAALFFTMTSSSLFKKPEAEKIVVAETEIKIDRSLIDQAKPLPLAPAPQPIVAKPIEVAAATPTPSPVQVAPPVVAETTVAPATKMNPVKAEVNKKPVTKVVIAKQTEVQEDEKNVQIPSKTNYHEARSANISKESTKTASNPNAGGGEKAAQMSASARSEQILSRHSKMLQDAFGGVLAVSKAGTPGGGNGGGGGEVGSGSAGGGKALGTTSNPAAAGSGFFAAGTGRGAAEAAGDGSGGTGGVAGKMIAGSGGNLKQFVKSGEVALGAKGTGVGYGKGNGNLGVAGQGSGVSYDGSGMVRSSGGLNQSAIAAVFRQHSAEVRNCYEMTLVNRPDIHGTVTLAFGIRPNGTVMNASVKVNALKDKDDRSPASSDLLDCIVKRVSSWTFPKPSDGNPVQITAYPIELKSVGGQ